MSWKRLGKWLLSKLGPAVLSKAQEKISKR